MEARSKQMQENQSNDYVNLGEFVALKNSCYGNFGE